MALNDLKIQFYKCSLLSIKRNGKDGTFNNAKPLLLLSIFANISDNYFIDNKIYFDDNLKLSYMNHCKQLESNINITPIEYPFYYIRNDGFIKLVGYENDLQYIRTPSAKYLRENVQYASFDNALWDLLQDEETRNYFREVIINHFFNQK